MPQYRERDIIKIALFMSSSSFPTYLCSYTIVVNSKFTLKFHVYTIKQKRGSS